MNRTKRQIRAKRIAKMLRLNRWNGVPNSHYCAPRKA